MLWVTRLSQLPAGLPATARRLAPFLRATSRTKSCRANAGQGKNAGQRDVHERGRASWGRRQTARETLSRWAHGLVTRQTAGCNCDGAGMPARGSYRLPPAILPSALSRAASLLWADTGPQTVASPRACSMTFKLSGPARKSPTTASAHEPPRLLSPAALPTRIIARR